jgi:hypothetical protein
VTAANRDLPFIEYCYYFLLLLHHFDACWNFCAPKILVM